MCIPLDASSQYAKCWTTTRFKFVETPALVRNYTLLYIYLFLVMIFVMACRMVVPAFSTSFLESPFVMQTFKAGRWV